MLAMASTDHGSRCGRNIRPQVGGSPGTHMPECCPCSTTPPPPPACSHCPMATGWSGSVPGPARSGAKGGEDGVLFVDRRLVAGVRLGLDLERAVLDVEVLAEALAEGVQHAPAVARRQRVLRDDDVRGED